MSNDAFVDDGKSSPLNDHYQLQPPSHLSSTPSAGITLGNTLDARIHMSALVEGDRTYGSMPDHIRSQISDTQPEPAYVRGRRPSRTGPKRQSRSRRSSSVISDQEQNLEVNFFKTFEFCSCPVYLSPIIRDVESRFALLSFINENYHPFFLTYREEKTRQISDHLSLACILALFVPSFFRNLF